MNPYNFRAPLIFAHLARAKIKGVKFAHQGARKLKGREPSFWVRENLRGANYFLDARKLKGEK